MNWIRQIFARRGLTRDLREEIQQHLDEKAEEFVAEGMSRRDAIAAARREFGHVTQIEETSRDVWRWRLAEDFISDIRFAFRQLRKSPAFACAGVLTLALGIGANTAVFSVVDAVVLRPLPYPESERLLSVQLRSTLGEPHPEALCYPTFFDFRRDNRVFENLVSYRLDDFVLTGSGSPMQVPGAIVSWDLFSLLKVQPELGRGFLPQEERAGELSVVISHGLWQRRFGGDASIVGRTISVDREPHTVVGIAPVGFHFPAPNASVELWTTLSREAALATAQPLTEQRSARVLNAIARLKPGVSVEQAQVQMDVIAAAEAKQYPDQNGGLEATYVRPSLDSLVGDLRQPVFLLLGAVGLVLLIACANIANLLLARTAERQREFALRAAIGASHSRIIRQVIAESLVLSLTGCTLGVLAAAGLLSWALPLAAESMPRVEQAGIDGRVLTFSIALAMLTSLLFSFAPAARLLRAQFAGVIQEGSRTVTDRSDRVRGALIAGQVALGLVLLSGASLLIASFVHLMRRDLGLQPEHVVTFSLNLPSGEYPRARQTAFHSRLLEGLASLPDVTSAATAMPLPLSRVDMNISFDIDGRPAVPSQRPSAKIAIVSPQYFRAMSIPILRGREFTQHDGADAPGVAIVNQAFADRFFPNEDALGKHIKPGATSDGGGPKMREIAGIVGNAQQSPLSSDAEPIYYLPYEQIPWCCPSIAVRTSGAPAAIEAAIRGIVESLDKQLAVSDVRTLDALLYEGVARPRFQMLLLTSFAAIALMLTVIGLYGVMTYSVVKRTRELGVRIALGAGRDAVLALVLKQAMLLVSIGIAMGLAGSWATGRLMTKMVYGVNAGDPFLLAMATGVITLTAAIAAYLPARRAASIDPMRALRME